MKNKIELPKIFPLNTTIVFFGYKLDYQFITQFKA